MSYKLPESAHEDRLIGFKVLYRLFTDSSVKSISQTKESVLDIAITSSPASIDTRQAYLKSIGIDVNLVIARSRLASQWKDLIALELIQLIAIGFYCAMYGLFSKSRANISLIPLTYVELCLLRSVLTRNQVKTWHDFAQFEVDSSLQTLFIRKHFPAIKVYKYPSPGPLTLHNSILITDTLCINSPYHREEINQLETIRYNELIQVPPEQYLNYQDCYKEQITPEFTIGYYSHGSWVRAISGDADDGLGIEQKEIELLNWLNEFIKEESTCSLKIFTHPIERKEAVRSQCHEFYASIFSDIKAISFAKSNDQSARLFDTCNVGVGVYSTILFERLYCGFKTFIVSPQPNFPIKNSSLSNISISDNNDFKIALRKSISLSSEEFFQINSIEGYSAKTNI